MRILRTDDDRFRDLPDWPYAPRYLNVEGGDGTPLRVHYIDEGPRDADPILLMHGNPTWSYLYRRMIPGLLAAGKRVVAPDLVGFGRSDKPAERSEMTLARHLDWMTEWLARMDLRRITLFCQDWGGTIGLHLVTRHPDRFDRVVASNTGMPIGEGEAGFLKVWVDTMREATAFPWQMFAQGMTRVLSEAELAAYRAPFPDGEYEVAALHFPSLITARPDHPDLAINLAAWEQLKAFDKPFLTLWGQRDPIARGIDARLQNDVRGAAGQPHHRFADANHFIQEDVPDELVDHILRFAAATATASEKGR